MFWGEKPGNSWSKEQYIKPETTEVNSLIQIIMAALDTCIRSWGFFWLVG